MRLGKLDNDQLERLVLSKFQRTRPESAGGPKIGLDCAVLDLGGDLTVLSCDPITSADIRHLGRLTVHVSCNDAAAEGAEPVGLLVTLLAPPNATEADIGYVADALASAAFEAGVDILGGHTEVTDGVTRFVTSAAVVARMPRDLALCGMQAGDDIVMTKWAALEGSAIIASDHAPLLAGLPAALVRTAATFIDHLSVVPEGRIARDSGATQMHDITEGGVFGAAWEMAALSGCGIVLDPEKIPLREETRAICRHLSLDPFRLISSGSMLIACRDAGLLIAACEAAGIPAACIGKAGGSGLRLPDGSEIAPPQADELYRLFAAGGSGLPG